MSNDIDELNIEFSFDYIFYKVDLFGTIIVFVEMVGIFLGPLPLIYICLFNPLNRPAKVYPFDLKYNNTTIIMDIIISIDTNMLTESIEILYVSSTF